MISSTAGTQQGTQNNKEGCPKDDQGISVSVKAEIQKDQKELLTSPTRTSFYQTFIRRSFSATAMITGFCLIVYCGPLVVTALTLFVQCFMYFEIMALSHRRDLEAQLPGFRFMSVLFLFVVLFYGYGRSLSEQFLATPSVMQHFGFLLDYHGIISFAAYTTVFILFVLKLRPGLYKYQFKQFAWIHMALFAIVVSLQFVVYNTHQGMIWFVLPVTLINVNDIFAYLSGVLFGRTQLIELSPKKTVEGFVGAAIATIITGFILAGSLRHYQFMVCPTLSYANGILGSHPISACQPNAIFQPQPYHIPTIISNLLQRLFLLDLTSNSSQFVMIAPIQIHAMVLSLFSSVIAPFGGFFASGLKRSLKIKDFGDLIPGHGGLSDRMDCQILMSVFTFIYLQTFIHESSVQDVLAVVLALKKQDQIIVFETLKKVIGG